VTGSTNNITEMLAIINGIKYINTTSTEAHPSIHIISDSGYVVRGYNDPSYLDRWMARGWRTSANGPVLNRNLWEKIVTLSWHAVLNLELIKGHKKDNNHIHAFWNDICDRICTYIMENKTEENKRYHFKYYFEDKFIQEVI
jgi:ribonuclease HI